MWAFDLIELNGIDLRRDPLGKRKAKLAAILARAAPGLRFNEHLDQEDGPLVFHHACKLGLEGIVAQRRGSRPQRADCRRAADIRLPRTDIGVSARSERHSQPEPNH
jgi:bifunctional non-homologous end joining protein LigD